MGYDLIISNPPYKKIGAEITYSIVKNVDWGTFINLLPANDYTRVKGLIGHVDLGTLTPILNAFEDAEVRTWVAKINKKPITITQDMFTLNTYDKKFQKFYAENMSRSHYAIDTFNMNPNVNSSDARVDWPVDKAFCITLRTAQDGVHRLEGKNIGFDVEFNVLGTKNFADVHAAGGVMWTCGFLYLETAVEKDNFVDFWYRGKLMNALIRGMNRSSGNVKPALPKVDWTRKWTDEQILKEFGYTAEEIADIMASL